MTCLPSVLTSFRAFHILLLFLSVQTIPVAIPDPEVDDMMVASDNLNLQKTHHHHKSRFKNSFSGLSKFGFNKEDSNSSLSKEIDEWLEELKREIEAAFNNTSMFEGFDDSFFDSSESKSSESEDGDAEKTNNAYAENI